MGTETDLVRRLAKCAPEDDRALVLALALGMVSYRRWDRLQVRAEQGDPRADADAMARTDPQLDGELEAVLADAQTILQDYMERRSVIQTRFGVPFWRGAAQACIGVLMAVAVLAVLGGLALWLVPLLEGSLLAGPLLDVPAPPSWVPTF